MASGGGETKFVWVSIKGGAAPIEVQAEGLRNVCALLKKVRGEEKPRLDNVPLGDILLYQSEQAKKDGAKALAAGFPVAEITGGTEDTNPLYVDFPDVEPAAKRQRTGEKDQDVKQLTAAEVREKVRVGIKDGKFRVPGLPPVRAELLNRSKACQVVTDYVKAVYNRANKPSDCKFPLLGCSGMMGIGKTSLLVHGASVLVPGLKNPPPDGGPPIPVAAAYISFNGGGGHVSTFLTSITRPNGHELLDDAFGHMMMVSCGVAYEVAEKLKFADCLSLYRLMMNLGNDEMLCFFVDEVGFLKNRDREAGVLSLLMSAMDREDGKLAFVFSHLQQEALDQQKTLSGRMVLPLPLPSLPIDAWRTLHPEAVPHVKVSPGLHQLFLACCGHPRALVDGIPAALREVPNLLTAPTKQTLIKAQTATMNVCKFPSSDDFMQKLVPKWFNFIEPMSTQQLSRDGLLIQVGDEPVQLLHPLLLQSWAQRESGTSAIAHHLQQLYAADSVVGPDAEKEMEAIMYHYEAVLRKAVEGKEFTLRQMYLSAHIGSTFDNRSVRAVVPKQMVLVEAVQDFSDMSVVLRKLNMGCIVVSQAHSEGGVEYFSPYVEVPSGKLIVAAVQCKFVMDSVNWSETRRKIEAATKGLEENDVEVFSVLYTTVDQERINTATYQDGVYFTQSDLFAFTRKLGILRLHCEKLGVNLGNKYPWLRRAGSMTGVG